MKIKKFKGMQQLILFGILILFCVIMTILSKDFLTGVNLMNILRQQSMVAIAAFGATFVMITGGMDISVGSTLALSGVVYALLNQSGMGIWGAAGIAVLAGGVVGLLNAGMIVGLKLNPVIATLGSMYTIRGVAYLLADGQAVVSGLSPDFMTFGRGYVGAIAIPILIMAIVFVIFYIIQSKTLLGKYTYAIGGNIETSRLSGISVNKVLASLYIITGVLTGIAGVIMASRLASGNPQIGEGFEFDVIIAIFLGGVSVKGGEGTVVGTLIGALIVGVLSNGLNLMGVNAFYQYIIKGVVLVLAVVIDMIFKSDKLTVKKAGKAEKAAQTEQP